MFTGRYILPALAPLALVGCALLPRPVDPQLVSLVESIHTEADTFYAGLGGKVAPDCAFAANSVAYDHLALLAGQLGSHLSATHASPALFKAEAALLRTIADARASHAAASARTDDADGICMASGAIFLNADAIDRATSALTATQDIGAI